MTHPQRLRETFERLRDSGFAGLEGTAVRLRLAIDEPLANTLIAESPRPSGVGAITVAFAAERRLHVRAKPSLPFLPPVTVTVEIDPAVVLTPTPSITLRMLREGLSSLAATALSAARSRLPAHVIATDDEIRIELAPLLARWDFGWVLAHLVAATVETEPGRLVLTIELRIPRPDTHAS
jgi:hypothetical protein